MSQLEDLNRYVRIENLKIDLESLSDTDLTALLSKYDCVILTEVKNLTLLIKINEICRSSGIKYLMSDVYGLVGWSFTDFGSSFECVDIDGEEYSEHFIGGITKLSANEIQVETLSDKLHHLESGDLVKFSEIVGLDHLNEKTFQVKVVNAKKFTCTTQESLADSVTYVRGGMFKQIKLKKTITFQSLQEQIRVPTLTLTDLSEHKFYNAYFVHVCLQALNLFHEKKLKTYEDFSSLVGQKLAEFNAANQQVFSRNVDIADAPFESLMRIVFYTSGAKFAPLCALYGGVVAQEAIKSVTNKFSPFQQWLHVECSDLYENATAQSVPELKYDRYDSLRICFGGEKTLVKLKSAKVFMVGCGAIGCEMLKNYAQLGIACDSQGSLTITDNDLIEKSNLSRQFLFRSHDIQKAKSVTAAKAIKQMNADVNVLVLEKKVCTQTESDTFTDTFFGYLDVCVNALDNVEARRYMDNRCVSNKKPLLETGTLGAKGFFCSIFIMPFFN